MITVRWPYGDHRRYCDVSTGYGLTIISNLSLCGVKQNRKVSLQRPHGNGDLDIVRASYTRRKANVTEAYDLCFVYF